jgi:hypothetical protein
MKGHGAFSALPSACLNSMTELSVLPRAAGKAPRDHVLLAVEVQVDHPYGPSLDTLVLVVLMVGTSMPSW